MLNGVRGVVVWLCVAAMAAPALAQVPVDAASDRRVGSYVFFKAFGEPKLPFEDLESAAGVRAKSQDYFRSELATCDVEKPTCNPDTVYELADRFCEALEFHEAATWRVSRDGDKLVLHWAVCGLKK
ncbi:MAG: hypothetical protein AAFO75_00930 [Pseudomonadota bacterium]